MPETEGCVVCGIDRSEFPMVFRNDPYCSDDHRKVMIGEKEPTEAQRRFMANRVRIATSRAIANLPGGFVP